MVAIMLALVAEVASGKMLLRDRDGVSPLGL
jgi:hypothetical protein